MVRMKSIVSVILLLMLPGVVMQGQESSTKKERNYIREGNKMYLDKRYADAEKSYRKALQENEFSPLAMFNLATTFLKQANPNDTAQNGLLKQAQNLLDAVAHSSDPKLASKAYYDLGNIAYNQRDYAKSISFYKDALRRNPDDDEARENLRLAQKQLQDQQQNQDKNNQNDNKDQQKQNQDQNKQKNQNGDNQNKQNPNQQKQPQQPSKNGMSKENAEQILQTMQNEEKNTQDKVNKAKMQQMQGGRRTGKQW